VASLQYYGTGRRKSATARVYLREGSGEFKVNRTPIDNYFKNETLRMIIRQPLQLTDTLVKFDVLVNVAGGEAPDRPVLSDTELPAPSVNSTGNFGRSSRRPDC